MNGDVRIEQLSDDNFHLFVELFNRVFKKNHSLDYLKKKYDTTYLGFKNAYLGYIATDENKAVSYCGSIPFLFRINGKEVLGAHSCDHMTLMEYRGRGLFNKLNSQHEMLVSNHDIPFIYGFPNQNNEPILVKYNRWQLLNQMVVFEQKIVTLPIKAIKNKLAPKKLALQVKDEELKFRNIKNNTLIKTTDYYDYKYNSKMKVYELSSAIVWAKVKGVMFVGDIILNAGSTIKQLLKELGTIARYAGIHKIVYCFSANHSLIEGFNSWLKPITGNSVGFKILNASFVEDLSRLSFCYADYDTY